MRITDHRLPVTFTNVNVDQQMDKSALLDEFAEALEIQEKVDKVDSLLEDLSD